jgi:hypothetical protein
MVPIITGSALIAAVVGEADMIDRGKAAVSRITAYALSFPVLWGRRDQARPIYRSSLGSCTPQNAGIAAAVDRDRGTGMIGVPFNNLGWTGTRRRSQEPPAIYAAALPVKAN